MSELSDFRKAKDDFFAGDKHSPLTPQQRDKFSGLNYYPENSQLRFTLKLEEFPAAEKETSEMATSTGKYQPHIRWGKINFTVDGEAVSLTVYRGVDQDEFFLPFTDATAGQETYGAGRYMEVAPVDHGLHLVDFNYAYSPYCAYNPRWSCPIPPFENRLKVPIRAGEKLFQSEDSH